MNIISVLVVTRLLIKILTFQSLFPMLKFKSSTITLFICAHLSNISIISCMSLRQKKKKSHDFNNSIWSCKKKKKKTGYREGGEEGDSEGRFMEGFTSGVYLVYLCLFDGGLLLYGSEREIES